MRTFTTVTAAVVFCGLFGIIAWASLKALSSPPECPEGFTRAVSAPTFAVCVHGVQK